MTHPRQVGVFSGWEGTGLAVATSGERIYVLTQSNGLFIFRHTAKPGARTIKVRRFDLDVLATVDGTTYPLGRAVHLENVEIREGKLPAGSATVSGAVSGIPITASLTLAVTSFEPLSLFYQEFYVAPNEGFGMAVLCPVGGCPLVTMTVPGTTRFSVTIGGNRPGIEGASFTFTGAAETSEE